MGVWGCGGVGVWGCGGVGVWGCGGVVLGGLGGWGGGAPFSPPFPGSLCDSFQHHLKLVFQTWPPKVKTGKRPQKGNQRPQPSLRTHTPHQKEKKDIMRAPGAHPGARCGPCAGTGCGAGTGCAWRVRAPSWAPGNLGLWSFCEGTWLERKTKKGEPLLSCFLGGRGWGVGGCLSHQGAK